MSDTGAWYKDTVVIQELLQALGCDYQQSQSTAGSDAAISISGLSADSRSLQQGEGFVALPGGSVHGLDYLATVEQRATAVLVDADDQRATGLSTSLPVLHIRGLQDKLAEIVSACYGHPSSQVPVCGITGTDGKTSTGQFVAHALHLLGYRAGFIGTIGWGFIDELQPNSLTTPSLVELHRMFALLRQRGAEFIVMEVSSHALVQGRVDGVWFDVATLTNLGRDHLDYHGTLENYRSAKKRLFEWPDLSALVLNLDDAFGLDLLHERTALASTRARDLVLHTYSVEPEAAVVDAPAAAPTLFAQDVQTQASGLSFLLSIDGVQRRIDSNLLGRFNVSNLLAAVGVLRAFGIDSKKIVDVLGEIKAVPGRMETFSHKRGPCLVVDFAHTAQALESALRTVRQHCDGKLWLVFGCGGDRDAGKRPEMGEVAERLSDYVVVTDDNPRTEASAIIIEQILAGMPLPLPLLQGSVSMGSSVSERIHVQANRRLAIEYAFERANTDDWILIAGKGHEDYQIIGDQRISYSDREVARSLVSGEAA